MKVGSHEWLSLMIDDLINSLQIKDKQLKEEGSDYSMATPLDTARRIKSALET